MVNIVHNHKNGKPKIYLIATGGTIASTKGENGLSPALSGREMLERIPGVYRIAGGENNIYVQDSLRLDSTNMRYGDRIRLAKEIQEAVRMGYDSIVITHGTDQMSNTACDLSLIGLAVDVPVILTGSMQPIGNADSDAQPNLGGAVAAAASRNPMFAGKFIYSGMRLLRGTRAVKIGGDYVFDTPHYSPTAILEHSGLTRHLRLKFTKKGEAAQKAYETRQERFAQFQHELFEYPQEINDRTGLIEVYTDANIDSVRKQAGNWYGMIVKGWGSGGIPTQPKGKSWSNLLQDWCRGGKLVIVASKVPYLISDLREYETGAPLLQAGAISAYDMNPEAALAKLRWSLGLVFTGKKPDNETAKRIVLHNFADEIGDYAPEHLKMSDDEAEQILKKFLDRKATLSTRYVKELLQVDTGATTDKIGRDAVQERIPGTFV